MVEPKANSGLTLINAFAMSFCSLGYQQLLALTLSDASGDFVLSQALTLALFLGGLGLGSALSEKISATWINLLRVEWLLALFGAACVSSVHFTEMILRFFGVMQNHWWLYLTSSPVLLLIGFLNGIELPLLLRLSPGLKKGSIIGANYLGAFAATVTVPLLLLPELDVVGSSHVLSIVNFLAASAILPRAAPGFNRLIHLGLGLILLLSLNAQDAFSRLHLQWIYFSPRFTTAAALFGDWSWWERLGTPVRVRSDYQWIDIVPPEFTERIQGRQDFQMYLDRKIQLSAGSHARYHESMAEGGLNLLRRRPERVLILGGGDGFLANELLRNSEIERIDLVELDPKVIELSTRQKELSRLNGGALKSPRVTVHLTDAFQFVRHTRQTYDLVLIDLPFPVNYELSLLFTKEFYALVKRRMAEDAVMVLDFPQPGGRSRHLDILVHTLRAAGFARPFAFGSEDFFVAAASNGRELKFRFEELVPLVSSQTLLNFVSRAEDAAAALRSPAKVNSVLFPLRFVSGDPGGSTRAARELRHAGNEGLLPLYFERFYSEWKQIAGLGSHDLPRALQDYLRQDMAGARDFVEEVNGRLVPRFQFGLEWRGDKIMPVYQWLDVKNPERLRRAWSKAYCMENSSDWIGVRWAGDKSWVEFFTARNFEPEPPLDGPIAPIPDNVRAAEIQFRIQRQFLINPRSVAVNRFYFP